MSIRNKRYQATTHLVIVYKDGNIKGIDGCYVHLEDAENRAKEIGESMNYVQHEDLKSRWHEKENELNYVDVQFSPLHRRDP